MLHKNELKPKKWVEKAVDDELSIKAILRDECGGPSAGCFLSQQMAEKYLKGLLVFYQKKFPKIHDLLGLETLLLEAYPDISEIHQELELLNRYYVETRYPTEYPSFTFNDCRQALEAALKVKNFVLAKIGFFEQEIGKKQKV